MTHVRETRLQFHAHRTELSVGESAEIFLNVGIDDLAHAIFRHEPPWPAELEHAIDIVEDALMETRLPHGQRGELVTSDPILMGLPGLQIEEAQLTSDDIESLFQRMASASLGNPAAFGDLPRDRRTCAALLILRECIHHLGYAAVRIRESAPGP